MKSDPIIALIISSQQYDKKKTNTEEPTCHRSSMSDLSRFPNLQLFRILKDNTVSCSSPVHHFLSFYQLLLLRMTVAKNFENIEPNL